ncbi:MAG: tRNA-dihydrouridine synthase family protein [Desulfobacterales bacterium]|nr:tRNA-dihydrouridine synthase family protein [Desulfobacterales bacterium]
MIELYLAPLKGFTDYIYRSVYSKHFEGIDLAVTPFITTMGEHKINKARIKDILPENNSSMKIVPQILSNNHDDFIHLAKYIGNLGYDELNLNLGCPHKNVVTKNKGSALLSDSYSLEKLLDKILSKIDQKLSVKIRTGYYNHNEIFDLIPVLNKLPLSEIIIHPRTGDQNYDGSVNIDIFDEAHRKFNKKIVYNGDIYNKEIFDDLNCKFTNISSWMIGRGVMCNPFLPAEIKNIKHKNTLSVIKMFHDDLANTYRNGMSGPAHYLDRMKGVWFFLTQSFPNGKKILKKIQKTRTEKTYNVVIEEFFDSNPAWKPKKTKDFNRKS